MYVAILGSCNDVLSNLRFAIQSLGLNVHVGIYLCHYFGHFRIIQLWEPFKENQLTRSVESWQNLVTKLRQLLLLSFNRHLGKFEDQVRALREKRTEPRWSFITYFLLHVSLLLLWSIVFGLKSFNSV